jgi:hypothetical protein
MTDTAGLVSIGFAGLIISLGAFQAYTILRKTEKKGRILHHELNRKTGKHKNPRQSGTRKKHT